MLNNLTVPTIASNDNFSMMKEIPSGPVRPEECLSGRRCMIFVMADMWTDWKLKVVLVTSVGPKGGMGSETIAHWMINIPLNRAAFPFTS